MRALLIVLGIFSIYMIVVLKEWDTCRRERICEYVYLRTDIDAEHGVAPHHTELDDVIVMASEHFNMSIEEVNSVLYEADVRGDNE
jgi:predicted nuclease of restriction endonuclease-like RecB superfamily